MDHQLCFLQHKNPTWLELDSDWLTDKALRWIQFLSPHPQNTKKNIFIHFWMNWDILMLFQFKCLKFIFFVKSSRIQGGGTRYPTNQICLALYISNFSLHCSFIWTPCTESEKRSNLPRNHLQHTQTFLTIAIIFKQKRHDLVRRNKKEV